MGCEGRVPSPQPSPVATGEGVRDLAHCDGRGTGLAKLCPEPGDGVLEAFFEGDLRLPAELGFGASDVGAAAGGVVFAVGEVLDLELEPVRRTTRAASSSRVNSPGLPRLNTPAVVPAVNMALAMPATRS